MKNVKIAFLIIVCFMVLISCKSRNEINCTTEYRMLTISVIDSMSKPVLLSQYFVKKTSTGEIINFKQEDPYLDSINRMNGVYFILTDGKMAMTLKNGTEFQFIGMIDNEEIVNEKYIIGNDGCHVQILSGKTQIIIKP